VRRARRRHLEDPPTASNANRAHRHPFRSREDGMAQGVDDIGRVDGHRLSAGSAAQLSSCLERFAPVSRDDRPQVSSRRGLELLRIFLVVGSDVRRADRPFVDQQRLQASGEQIETQPSAELRPGQADASAQRRQSLGPAVFASLTTFLSGKFPACDPDVLEARLTSHPSGVDQESHRTSSRRSGHFAAPLEAAHPEIDVRRLNRYTVHGGDRLGRSLLAASAQERSHQGNQEGEKHRRSHRPGGVSPIGQGQRPHHVPCIQAVTFHGLLLMIVGQLELARLGFCHGPQTTSPGKTFAQATG